MRNDGNFGFRIPDLGLKNLQSAIHNPQSKGFSLIEIIVLLVVLSIAAVGVLSVFTTGTRGSAEPVLLDQAISLAQEKMDEVVVLRKSGGFNAVVSSPGGAFPAPYGAFSWVRTVECVTAADVNTPTGLPLPCTSGYARVTVTVSWNVGAGSLTASTLMTDY
jgi:type II secretory pathway pseudopilin PulG